MTEKVRYDILHKTQTHLDLSIDGQSISVSIMPSNESSFWEMGRLGYLRGKALEIYEQGPPLFFHNRGLSETEGG